MDLKKIKIILPLAEEDVYALAEASKHGALKQAEVTAVGINTIPPDMLRLNSGLALVNALNAKFAAASQQLKALGIDNKLEIHNATYIKPAVQHIVAQADLALGSKNLDVAGIVAPADLLAKQAPAAVVDKLDAKVANTDHDAVKAWRKKITTPSAVSTAIKPKVESTVELAPKLKR